MGRLHNLEIFHAMAGRHLWKFFAACLLLSGCASLPDTQPFTDATLSLRSAVAASGTAVVAELRRTPLPGISSSATNLENAWKTRNGVMSALVEYANSLQAITDAGKKGEESAKQLADAVNVLAQSLGAASLGASEAGGLAIDTFGYVYGQIAKARAAKSLELALGEIQPAIERIATLLAADQVKLDELIQVAIEAEHDALETDNQREIGYRRQLVDSRRQLMGIVGEELKKDKANITKIERTDELGRLGEMLAATDSWNLTYTNQQNTIAERGRIAREMIAATQAAFSDWAAGHARLLAAVRAKRTPSAVELAAAATRIRELVDRYRRL